MTEWNEPLARREPPADLRQAARAMRDLFAALRQEGFTEAQALVILGNVIAAVQGKGGDSR